MKNLINKCIEDHKSLVSCLNDQLIDDIEKAALLLVKCLQNGHLVAWCGNGGSASDAEHLCAELVGRFTNERAALKSIAFSANSASVTSISNDYGYENLFSRQVEALCESGDVLIAISTSGNSENVVRAVKKAKELDVQVVGLLGNKGGKLIDECEISLLIPSNSTARIQEMHILIGHILCEIIDNNY